MICGIRGERGVCPMDSDHTGACETNRGEPLHFTKEESQWNRYQRILGDLSFVLLHTARIHSEGKLCDET